MSDATSWYECPTHGISYGDFRWCPKCPGAPEAKQHSRYAEAQDALLAWARDKARHPFFLGSGAMVCLFCKSHSSVNHDGSVNAAHAAGCIALRAIAEGVA